jgi:hypothetical protein
LFTSCRSHDDPSYNHQLAFVSSFLIEFWPAIQDWHWNDGTADLIVAELIAPQHSINALHKTSSEQSRNDVPSHRCPLSAETIASQNLRPMPQ